MFSLTSELFEFNKMIFIYLITIFILFFWLLKMILIKKIIIKKTSFDLPFFIFLLTQCLSTFFSIDPHVSFFGYYGRFNGGLLSIIAYIVLFYGFVSNVNLKNDYKFFILLLKTSLISSTIVIFWGLLAKIGYDFSCLIFTGKLNNSCWTDQFRPAERIFSTLGQPNWLGAYLVINFFIGLYFFIKEDFKIKYTILIFYLLLNFSSILFTRSRSAFIALIFSLSFFLLYRLFNFIKKFCYKLFFNKKSFNNTFKNLIISERTFKLFILILIILIPIFIFGSGIKKIDNYFSLNSFINFLRVENHQENHQKNNAYFKESLISKNKVTDSFEIRKIVWKGAIELGKKYPFFGTGVETFGYSYYFVRPKEHNLTSEWDYLYNKAHNEYLNYLATTGFFGLSAYLLIILLVFYLSILNFFKLNEKKVNIETKNINKKEEIFDFTKLKLINLCLITAYLSILITNFSGFSTTTINIFFYLIPAFIFLIYNLNDENDIKLDKNFSFKQLTNKQKIFLLILLLITSYLLFFILKYWLADYYYEKANVAFKNNQYQLAVFYLKEKALNLKYEHVYEDKLSYFLSNLAFLNYYQKEKTYASYLKNLSIYYNNKSISSSPKNVLYWKTKAKIYYIFFQMDLNTKNLNTAIEALKKAQILAPTDPKIPYTLAFFNSILYEQVKNNKEKELYKNESLKAIDHSIYLKNDMIEAYLLKGQLLKKYNKVSEAKKVYRYLFENLDSHNEEAKRELGIK